MDTHFTPEQIFLLVVQITVMLFAISFHESAHGLVALKCGDTTARDQGRISMNPIRHIDPMGSLFVPMMMAIAGGPIFGWAKPVQVSLRGVPNPRRANLLVSGAGPVSNLILAVAFALVLALLPANGPKDLVVPLGYIAYQSVVVNVSLCVFNLLPIPPLDGFGVLESVVPARLIPATIWLRRYGIVIFLVMIFTGAHRFVLGPAVTYLLRLLIH